MTIGIRLECETYPGLTARDGYYTKKEFVHFQEEAAERFVEIIPEIDIPAPFACLQSLQTGIRQQGIWHGSFGFI